MDTGELFAKLQKMTIEEKLVLLSDIDKAYLRGYLDRAALEFQPVLREAVLSKEHPAGNVRITKGANTKR